MWRIVGLIGAVAACNAVFGNDQVHTKIDDLRLLKPPLDAPASCPPPPDFSTWTIAPRAYPGVAGGVVHPTFLSDQDVAFTAQLKMYEGSFGAPAVAMVGLDDMTGAELYGPSAAPGGDVFWYERYANLGAGLYYAVRDGDQWTPHGADFPLTAYSIEPGAAGFYGSEVRMVVAVQHTRIGPFELVELSSPDGTSWTELDPLPFDVPVLASQYFDPALSTDGCVLLFSREGIGIEVALRGPDGTFGPPFPFPGASGYPDAIQPAITPDETLVWWESTENGDRQATP